MDTQASEKYLLFNTGGRSYAVRLKYVKEILRMVTLQQVSELPSFVTGVVNLRGIIIPVIDFKLRAGLDKTDISVQTRIMIIKLEKILIGVLVDKVQEVIDVLDNDISKHVQPDTVLDSKYIDGMTVYQNQWITLININDILTDKEWTLLDNKVNEQPVIK